MLYTGAWAASLLCAAASAADPSDVQPVMSPEDVHFDGLLGARLAATAEGRLLRMDEDALLAGFRQRPGSHPWIGEHVGKFLHAAILASVYTGNAELREKVLRVTDGLLKTQLDDGYLGTYAPDRYWTSWDVWVHKYCLYGLLTVHRYLDDRAALAGARKIGDLMCRTFGPGKRDIIKSGTHVGMAATSIMEPMMMLYGATGEQRYLEFCSYLVESWNQEHGPHILESLLSHGKVNRTANGKAYEMMSNLVGLCELYRATGEERYLKACLNAWQDIVDNQMYVTGGTSLGEHFQPDHHLPNSGRVSENCAHVTWLQLNAQLLRLTGEARFAEVLETLIYNHLFASQHPAGWEICYFTPLEGTKPYGSGINCCTSSNSRGVMLIPTFAYSVSGRDVYANIHAPGQVSFTLPDSVGGPQIVVRQTADYPNEARLSYEVDAKQPARFSLWVRIPAWCREPRCTVNGTETDIRVERGYARIRREWQQDDLVEMALPMPVEIVEGEHGNDGLLAVRRGPLIYAIDEGDNPGLPPLAAVGLSPGAEATVLEANLSDRTWPGERLIVLGAALAPRFRKPAESPTIRLRPFADAGHSGSRYRVWLPGPRVLAEMQFSELVGGGESWSRQGNVEGSINDGDLGTWRVTFDGRREDADWYAVALDGSVTISRVVYAHGNSYHDGGWFDASGGKPKIQVRRSADGPWEDVAVLDSYPATTATDSKGLKQGQAFEARFDPVEVYAVRIVGPGAHGDNPNQCFSSCSELQAFSE
jgi:DUF1680 family protein